jgi:hypothetical protein
MENHTFYMPNPPDRSFSSRMELELFLRNWAEENGYVLSIKRSTSNKNFVLSCDRSGEYRNILNLTDVSRIRQTGTRKTGCQFSIKGVNRDGIWSFWIQSSGHNHPPETDLRGHAMARRMSEPQKELVMNAINTGSTPRAALALARELDSSFISSSQDLKNLKNKIKRNFLNGRSEIEAFFDSLEESETLYYYRLGDNNEVINLMVADAISISLARKYNLVILMDCTYKTNKYKMPVLNVVGISPFNKSFFICLVFLKEETEPHYSWALQKIKEIYAGVDAPKVIATDRELALMNSISAVLPCTTNLLCLWHIEKNVVAKCKKMFSTSEGFNSFMDLWKSLVYCKSEVTFDQEWKKMQDIYGQTHPAIMYLSNAWMVYKEKFVSVWADRVLHLGSKNTSRVEGANAVLKLYLNSSVSDLSTLHLKFRLAIKNQHEELRTLELAEKNTILHFSRNEIFHQLAGKITHFALKRIYESYKQCGVRYEQTCSRTEIDSMGLPCSHFLNFVDSTIPLESIHPFWHYSKESVHVAPPPRIQSDTNDILSSIQERIRAANPAQQSHALQELRQIEERLSLPIRPPVRQATRGRPPGALNSTRREPSAFEVELALPGGAPPRNHRRCTRCNVIGSGHNAATCPLRNNVH